MSRSKETMNCECAALYEKIDSFRANLVTHIGEVECIPSVSLLPYESGQIPQPYL